jgi:magnesium transporter
VGHNDRVIVDCALYRGGVREPTSDDLPATLEQARSEPECFVWLGLHDPEEQEFERVAEVFGLHPLAVEDAVKAHQRPKLEEYDDSLFVVLKTVRYDEDAQQIELGEVNLFIGDAFVVSVRHGQGRALAEVRSRLEREKDVLGCGPSSVLYAVCDRVVDDYTRIAFEVEQDIEEIEEHVFSPVRSDDAGRIYNLKREVIEFRHAVRPLVEPTEKLAAGLVPHVAEGLRPFFRDVADHTVRVSEQVDSFDDLLNSVLNANLAQVGVQQNSDMRRISAWVAIAAVPTMLAGIWGMNFDHMPELGWQLGYPAALAVMVVAGIGLYRAFRRSGWL